MKPNSSRLPLLLLISSLPFSVFSQASFINGDPLPDAPALSYRGDYRVGVKTIDLVHMDQLDILHSSSEKEVRYDRPLKLEVWYPAVIPAAMEEICEYEDVLGRPNDPKRPLIPFQFQGRAMREAIPLSEGQFPLIVLSHGYPGSRVLLTYLTENLASKGYIVVAIDHTESTHSDAAGFASTLLNRRKDITYVVEQAGAEAAPFGFLSGVMDSENVGLIGYSMGGYGVVNVAGGAYSDQLTTAFKAMANGSEVIREFTTENENFGSLGLSQVKAVVAFAPWGMQRGLWDKKGLEGIKTPIFFIAGDQDDVSGYDKGTKAIFTHAVNADRYLLTYKNARHNVAPNPPPPMTYSDSLAANEYAHYSEPSWDERKINNINQHFVTAFFGVHLKNEPLQKYLDVQEDSNAKTWEGFKPRSSTGMELLHSSPGKDQGDK